MSRLRATCGVVVTSFAIACGSPTGTGYSSGTGPSNGNGDGGTNGAHADGGSQLVSDSDGSTSPTFGSDASISVSAACTAAAGGQSTVGCDYYAVIPDVEPIAGGCFATFLANNGTTPVSLTVDFDGQSLDASKFAYLPSGTGLGLTYAALPNGQIPPGQVAIVFLDESGFSVPIPPLDMGCPAGVNVAFATMDLAQHGTGIGHAFHIETNEPVVAYDIYPYGGGQTAVTSATLLLPTSSWGTNYVAADAFATSSLSGGQPFIDFVAEADGTTITISASSAIVGGTGVAPAAQGVPQTYSLSRGQVLHLSQPDELVGSVIQSNFPIGSWGGSTCLNVDVNTCCCDSAHQQIPPIRALGSEYVGVRYRNRWDGSEESPPWRIVGAADGTTLTYDPAPPAGAPTTLNLGQVVEFDTNGPFVISSQDAQHPFYMAGYMTGAETNPMGMSDGRGDPEFVNVIPPAEYLSSYVFFTDPTYPETDLVVVRPMGQSGFADVTLDCLGTLTGWQPVGAGGKYEYTRVDLVRDNFVPQGNCNNGRHTMQSANPVGLTVWGWGSAATGTGLPGSFYTQYVSYAYPAGQSVAPINTVVVPPSMLQ